ncbi:MULTISPECIES: N-6 DNA methylase [Klebsiella pneumoniae complex]|uniref:N-6 DNA methylase n=1 Tax=Klebsiella pneumoniae complex TaxID=3390273 RepID=UPI000E2A9B6F|nr:N-6 DNA methylase [Klebsiella variicola]HCA3680725.1 N-6 DNA methylase [Klebsiella pneumoniae]SXF28165.1 Type I restriction-modification system methyltransferase subunit [Klebsiella variicola]HCI8535345.1 N-6 DNA methylase [Klebsiella variicola]HCI8642944.1 N-6 DNA methylase [Klebsiella variicola]HCI8781688.1 N-6 DNA methylase [Klebsiella variicola]
MNSFIKYNEQLKNLYSSYINEVDLDSFNHIFKEDDPHEYLRLNENINSLRDFGVFFTGEELSAECAQIIAKTLREDSRVIDPCCGAGNLLVALTKYLPVSKTLTETLVEWNLLIHGFDLMDDFVEAAKIRIIFQALNRGVLIDEKDLQKNMDRLNNIKCKNGLDDDVDLNDYTHVIINPPYNQSLLNEYKYWSGGKVNLAAVFIDKYITDADKGMHIVAILPDVLRSGSRYEKWRGAIEQILSGEIILKGRFDKKTDVDVFVLNGVVDSVNTGLKWTLENTEGLKLSDYFSVSIGKVVPYRDPQQGELHAYIYPGLLKSWDKIDSRDIKSIRRHESTPILPPFITIKRTSSPKDKNRAGAHLIYGTAPVFVENHLIVVKPFDDNLDKCKKLLEHLKSSDVNIFLNDVIRCRHLTVKVVKDIPLKLEEQDEETNK